MSPENRIVKQSLDRPEVSRKSHGCKSSPKVAFFNPVQDHEHVGFL